MSFPVSTQENRAGRGSNLYSLAILGMLCTLTQELCKSHLHEPSLLSELSAVTGKGLLAPSKAQPEFAVGMDANRPTEKASTAALLFLHELRFSSVPNGKLLREK